MSCTPSQAFELVHRVATLPHAASRRLLVAFFNLALEEISNNQQPADEIIDRHGQDNHSGTELGQPPEGESNDYGEPSPGELVWWAIDAAMEEAAERELLLEDLAMGSWIIQAMERERRDRCEPSEEQLYEWAMMDRYEQVMEREIRERYELSEEQLYEWAMMERYEEVMEFYQQENNEDEWPSAAQLEGARGLDTSFINSLLVKVGMLGGKPDQRQIDPIAEMLGKLVSAGHKTSVDDYEKRFDVTDCVVQIIRSLLGRRDLAVEIESSFTALRYSPSSLRLLFDQAVEGLWSLLLEWCPVHGVWGARLKWRSRFRDIRHRINAMPKFDHLRRVMKTSPPAPRRSSAKASSTVELLDWCAGRAYNMGWKSEIIA